jgi:preprotein translocase subunit SecF
MLFRRLNWNVVGWFRTVSLISYAIILAGLVMMGYNLATKGYPIKLGLSFTGGTDVTVKYQTPTSTDAIKAALAKIGVNDAQVNTLSKAGEPANERFTISTQTDFGNDTARLWNALGTLGPVDRAQSEISSVGPSLSREYLLKAVEALIIAIAIQFIYIAFRFGWNYIFGLVTVIALVRDAAMMIGIYALAQKRADDAFLAAVLTVIGYSVMDTIVILDRIRENTKLMDGEPYDKIVNTSILQTMARSVNTLATVVITLVALLALGGASLQNFGFALLVGICSGGYHSIFYSAPLVTVLRKRQLEREAARRKRALERGEVVEERGKRPRTVAEARAQQRQLVDRAEVIAKRRERKEKQKLQGARPSAGPARYRRKRAVETLPEETAEESVEPYELQHEEIRLNLDAFEEDAPKEDARKQ